MSTCKYIALSLQPNDHLQLKAFCAIVWLPLIFIQSLYHSITTFKTNMNAYLVRVNHYNPMIIRNLMPFVQLVNLQPFTPLVSSKILLAF